MLNGGELSVVCALSVISVLRHLLYSGIDFGVSLFCSLSADVARLGIGSCLLSLESGESLGYLSCYAFFRLVELSPYVNIILAESLPCAVESCRETFELRFLCIVRLSVSRKDCSILFSLLQLLCLLVDLFAESLYRSRDSLDVFFLDLCSLFSAAVVSMVSIDTLLCLRNLAIDACDVTAKCGGQFVGKIRSLDSSLHFVQFSLHGVELFSERVVSLQFIVERRNSLCQKLYLSINSLLVLFRSGSLNLFFCQLACIESREQRVDVLVNGCQSFLLAAVSHSAVVEWDECLLHLVVHAVNDSLSVGSLQFCNLLLYVVKSSLCLCNLLLNIFLRCAFIVVRLLNGDLFV